MKKQLSYLIKEYELNNIKPYQKDELINLLLEELNAKVKV